MGFNQEWITCNNIRIHITHWEGAGETLLAVHGITSNSMCWQTVATALTPDHRLIAMDLRGRGLSDKPATGYSVDHHIQDIQSLIDQLKLPEVVLIGHSLGAFISLAFAARFPERTKGLILIDGGGSMAPEKWNRVAAAIQPSKERLGKVFASKDAYLAEAMKQAYNQPWNQARADSFLYELESEGNGVRCNIDPEHIKEEATNIRKIKPESFYTDIGCKTMIIRATEGLAGKDDILLPDETVDQMKGKIRETEIVGIEDANHYSILFDPFERRDSAIRDFLSTLRH